jgi:hypothetical protein
MVLSSLDLKPNKITASFVLRKYLLMGIFVKTAKTLFTSVMDLTIFVRILKMYSKSESGNLSNFAN